MYLSKYVHDMEKFSMSFFEKIVMCLQAEMETPALYGAFHIMFALLTIACSAFLIWKFHDADEKTTRRILLGTWIAIAVLEIYKQIVFSMDVSDGVATWSYTWYAFPFQFCSSPLYVLPFAALLKEGRAKDATMSFLSTFALFGGLVVMIYPGDVFIGMIGINIQTMVHHGSQVVIGLFLAARNRHRFSFKFFLMGIIPFAILSAIAMGLNEVVHVFLTNKGLTDTFNMFFISRHHDCTLPVLSSIAPKLPYPAFLMVYLLGFVLAAGAIFGLEAGGICLAKRRSRGTEA